MPTEYDAFARFYELEYRHVTEDLDMYLQFARRAGAPILETTCGTGRVIFALAQAGFRVIGSDASPAMLSIARRKLAAMPKLARRVTLLEGDARQISLPRICAMALFAVNSFMHFLTREDQLAALSVVHRHLMVGGLLIIDLFNPDLAIAFEGSGRLVFDRVLVDEETGSVITKMVAAQVDRATQINKVTLLYDEIGPNGTVTRTLGTLTQRYFYRYEMENLLETAGFSMESVYGSYDLAPFTADSPKMIIVATRR